MLSPFCKRGTMMLLATSTVLALSACSVNAPSNSTSSPSPSQTAIPGVSQVVGSFNAKPTWGIAASSQQAGLVTTQDGKTGAFLPIATDNKIQVETINLEDGSTNIVSVDTLGTSNNPVLVEQGGAFILLQTNHDSGKWSASIIKNGQVSVVDGQAPSDGAITWSTSVDAPVLTYKSTDNTTTKYWTLDVANHTAVEHKGENITTKCADGTDCTIDTMPLVVAGGVTISSYNQSTLFTQAAVTSGGTFSCKQGSTKATDCARGFTNGTLDSRNLAPSGADKSTGTVRAYNGDYLLVSWTKSGDTNGNSIFRLYDVHDFNTAITEFTAKAPAESADVVTLPISSNGEYATYGNAVFSMKTAGNVKVFDSSSPMTLTSVSDDGKAWGSTDQGYKKTSTSKNSVQVDYATGNITQYQNGVLPQVINNKVGVFTETKSGNKTVAAYNLM